MALAVEQASAPTREHLLPGSTVINQCSALDTSVSPNNASWLPNQPLLPAGARVKEQVQLGLLRPDHALLNLTLGGDITPLHWCATSTRDETLTGVPPHGITRARLMPRTPAARDADERRQHCRAAQLFVDIGELHGRRPFSYLTSSTGTNSNPVPVAVSPYQTPSPGVHSVLDEPLPGKQVGELPAGITSLVPSAVSTHHSGAQRQYALQRATNCASFGGHDPAIHRPG